MDQPLLDNSFFFFGCEADSSISVAFFPGINLGTTTGAFTGTAPFFGSFPAGLLIISYHNRFLYRNTSFLNIRYSHDCLSFVQTIFILSIIRDFLVNTFLREEDSYFCVVNPKYQLFFQQYQQIILC
jgi:hypothetical protein